MPIVFDLARLSPARGCVWRRCHRCGDLCVLPHRIHTCTSCADRPGRVRHG